MYNAEEQTATRTLRLAFSLGQEAAAAAALEPPVASAVATKSCTSTPLLDVGIITAPTHTDRRESLRAAYARLLQGSRCEVSLFFILGNLSDIPKQQRVQISSEHSLSGDILWLPAHDGKTAGVSHGGRAVAEKALSWFIHAAKHTQAPFVMKVDDDTTAHLPRLLLHVERLRTQVTIPTPPFFPYVATPFLPYVRDEFFSGAECSVRLLWEAHVPYVGLERPPQAGSEPELRRAPCH